MNRRQAAFLIAKLAFAIAVFAWLSRKVDTSRVWGVLREAQRAPVILGIALFLLTVVIAAWRWHRLLAIVGISIPLRSLFCIVQIGQFFAVFLPGPTGDDLTRMLYISRLAKGRIGEACTTVLIDRLIGLASVLALALVCIPWHWHLLATSRQTYWIAVGILGAGGAVLVFGTIFFVSGHPTERWFHRCLGRLPAHNLRDEVTRIWGLLCANKRSVGKIVGAAVTTQLLACMFFFLAGLAVGIRAPFHVWLGFVPIVLAANAVPITVAGLGVREYLLVLFLGVLGRVEGERALAASIVVLSMTLAICLIGGILYLFYRPRGDAAHSDD